MTCFVLMIAGLAGSGKTSVSSYISRLKKIPVVRMGTVTDFILEKRGLPINESGEQKVRRFLRRSYGSDIYAKSVVPILKQVCKTHPLVILEGVKSQEEWSRITEIFPQVKILYLDANRTIRHQRLATRKDRRLTSKEAEKRDSYETKTLHGNKLRLQAHFLIQNEGTKKALYEEVETILEKLGRALNP